MGLFELYVLFMISAFGNFFTAVAIVSLIAFGIVTVISFLAWSFDNSTHGERVFKSTRWWLVAPVVMGLVATAIPGKQDMLMIAGLYYASNIQGVNELPANVVKVLNNTLSSYASEILEETNKRQK